MIFLLLACNPSTQDNNKQVSQVLPEEVDFNFHIKPILSDRCFACHGPDEKARKADLRLDIKEAAFALVDSVENRFAIVPGSLKKSELARRISSLDPDYMMPPPESNLSLTDYEIDLLKKWIEEGAEWKPHWSFIPPQITALPEPGNKDWPENPIDHFILSKMQAQGLQPSVEAEKTALIRRLSFDLTGLPPSPEEVEGYIADNSENAYEKMVDHFLASPAYGERMVSPWLDVSRYADSHGYQDDRPRTMWPWRDWVIDAFNRNLPYNDFVTWQLAGDLLPNASFEQKLATGFNRNHPITQEGGVIQEEYLTEYAADRAQTFSTAFIGLTMQCSRCHDHKYDPIKQKEFYQLFSFFTNNDEKGQISYSDLAPKPSIKYENVLLENEIEAVKTMLAEVENEKQKIMPEVSESILRNWFGNLDWEVLREQGLEAHFDLDLSETGFMKNNVTKTFSGTLNFKLPANLSPPATVPGKFKKALEFDGTNTLTIGDIGDFEFYNEFSLGGWINYSETPEYNAGILSRRNGEMYRSGYGLYLGKDNSLRFQIVAVDYGTSSRHFNSTEKLIEVRTKTSIPKNKWTNIFGTYDGSGKASGVTLLVNGERQEVEILSDNLERNDLYFEDNESILVGTQFTVGHWMMRGKKGNNLSGFKGAIDEISIYNRELSPLEVKYIFDNEPEYESNLVYETYLKRENREIAQIENKLDSLRSIDTEIPRVMIMEELDSIKPAYILERGVYSAKGERVDRGTPESILEFSKDLPQNRLGLAKWLFDERNPLTSRVIVNRFWQMIFGKGLVATPEDFGNQGALPTHPELLDWLALEFMNDGWDMKKLVKLMVMSSTYRQSSTITQKKYQQDPENVYLSRGPYKKLTAEMIRDQALAASGLLNLKIGGKWVKPYQPPGIWEELANQIGENKYRPGKGADLYRRSIYTYWKRTIPVPSMLTFDASERAMCTVKRQATSTPLQSLVLLNDTQYIEASRRLAENLINTAEDNPVVWIEGIFRRLVSRSPSATESDLLMEIYQSELQRFMEDDKSGFELIQIGDSPTGENFDRNKLAALTVVASAIFNLDETSHS
ncbi:MAG: DUF1553 domain-containing protein [Bacteroidetes bacterium]|nr:DUF1553 domain-containing protein [Bacteroidota bacterium]